MIIRQFGKVWPGVLEAVNLIGSKQVQGRASADGNLCNSSPAGDSDCPRWSQPAPIVTVGQGQIAAAKCRWSRCRRAPAAPLSSRAEIPGQFQVAAAAAKAPGDALLRMIPREMDASAVSSCAVSPDAEMASSPAPRQARRLGGPDSAAGRGRRQGLIGNRLDDAALEKRPPPPAVPPAVRSTTSRSCIACRTKIAEAFCSSAPPPSPPGARETEPVAKLHVTTSINGEPMEFCTRPNDTMLDAACAALALWRLKRLRVRRLRRLLDHARRPRLVCSCLMLAAEARVTRSGPSKAWRSTRRAPASAAAKTTGLATAMWHLHLWHTGRLRRTLAQELKTIRRGRSPLLARRKSLPVHQRRQDRSRGFGGR